MAVAGLAFELERRRTGAREFSAEMPSAQSSAQVETPATPALSLAWGGSAQANFDSQQLNRDHELSVRFMAAYEAAFRGVLLADESGSYRIGLAPYALLGTAAIEVRVGGAILSYPLSDSPLTNNDFRQGVPRQPRAKWRVLAVNRQGERVTVSLDGAQIGELTAGSLPANGQVRLGRLAQTVRKTNFTA